MIWLEMLWHEDGKAALLVSLAFAGFFIGAEVWRRLGNPPVEWTRKSVHVAAGILVCCFPWIFQNPWSVAILSFSFAGILLLARFLALLPSVQGVERHSVGELLFPLSTALLFFLAHQNRVFYLIPMLTLVVSDALAALIGKAYGKNHFVVDAGHAKSVEGSVIFFLSSFLAVLIPLMLMTQISAPAMLLLALQMAWLVTSFEAISLSGIDNIVLPIGGWYLITELSQGNFDWTLIQIGAELSLALLCLVLTWRYRLVTSSGFLALQLYFYGAFAYGGPLWVSAPLLSVVLLLFLLRSQKGDQTNERFQVLATYYACLGPFLLLLLYNFSAVYLPQLLEHTHYVDCIHACFEGLHAGEIAAIAFLVNWGTTKRLRYPAKLLQMLKFGSASWALIALPSLLFRKAWDVASWRESLLSSLLSFFLSLFCAALWPRKRDPLWSVRILSCGSALGAFFVLLSFWNFGL